MQDKPKEVIPCANQNIPLTSPSAASAAKNTPAWPTAAGASSGTNVPGTLPSPNLPDKAAGVYEALGPFELLCQLVSASERTASTAAEAAALFAGFVRDGYSPTLDQIYSCAGRLTGKLGQLLAILDVILEAADLHRLQDCDQQLRQAYVVLLAEIYAAREKNTIGISSRDLAREIPGAIYCPTLRDVTEQLRQIARPGDLILTVGAGDIYTAGEALLHTEPSNPTDERE